MSSGKIIQIIGAVIDVETQALLRLLDEVKGDAPDTKSGRDSFSPLCVGAADLLAEKAAHEQAKELLRKAHAEYAALQQRVAADQSAALEASQRADSLAKEAGVLGDRLTLIKRQLQDEVNAHALTRKQLEEQREATQAAERRRRGNGVLGAIGGAAALGLGLLLRRK